MGLALGDCKIKGGLQPLPYANIPSCCFFPKRLEVGWGMVMGVEGIPQTQGLMRFKAQGL